MNQHWHVRNQAIWVLATVLICGTVTPSHAEDVYTQVEGGAHAKAFAVLRATFPYRGEVSGVGLRFSRDGETFEQGGFGLPRSWHLFTSVSSNSETTTVLVAVGGRFGMGWSAFLFPEPGTYWLRWGINFKDKDALGFKVYQTVEVGQPTQADLEFLAHLGDPGLLKQFLGRDFLESLADKDFPEWVKSPDKADFRALAVISELLKATRADEPGKVVGARGSIENALKSADALLALAKELPESSYAPYAAYYAGCCYIGGVMGDNKQAYGELISPEAKGNQYYQKAREALDFAAENGDAYLKPRAIYMEAFLRICTTAFDEADALLKKAAGTEDAGTISDLVTKLRKDIAMAKAELKKRHSQRRNDGE